MDAAQTQGSGGRRTSTTAHSKRFVCDHPGCEKRFTRAEHLQRHALNHTAGQSTCSRCRAHFKRPDLLERHMIRHRQKDIEAGGTGCGILDTRKRSWKNLDGSVVEKRPHPSRRARPSNEALRAQREQQELPVDATNDALLAFAPSTLSAVPGRGSGADISVQHPISPFSEPDTDQNRSPHEHHDDAIDVAALQEDISHFNPTACDLNQPFLVSAYDQPWIDPLPLDPAIPGIPDAERLQYDYEQLFQPDTASSFNMPYTTALDYNWLFNMHETLATRALEARTGIQEAGFGVQGMNQALSQRNSVVQGQLVITPPESQHSCQKFPDTMDATHNGGSISHAERPDRSPSNISTRRSQTQPPGANLTALASDPTFIEPERPLSILLKSVVLRKIDENVRNRLLTVVESASPSLPEQQSIWDHPLLSTEALQSYLDLYFTKFNTAYPLIHLATFEPAQVEPLLLLSIILLGATYSEKDAHQLAVCIHDVIRPSIFAHADFSARAELWTLQTILLVECFGKSRAGQKQHDMSHLFHGLLINLIRRSDCQSVRPAGPPAGERDAGSLDKTWKQWAEAEQKKRLAFLCFMWDTQHAALFCQSLCMSAFELRLPLPCSQSIWEARDAASWKMAWRASPTSDVQTFFLPTLKSYLAASAMPQNRTRLGALSRVLVLHGLISIAWDMQRRDQTSLGVVSRGPTLAGEGTGSSWRGILSTAYDAWKTDFDEYCSAVLAHGLRYPQQVWGHDHDNNSTFGASSGNGEPDGEAAQQRAEFIAFASAYNAVYYSAQSLLCMDFLDVQIYAGARHILGRPVQQKDYLHSAKIVRRWASESPCIAPEYPSPKESTGPLQPSSSKEISAAGSGNGDGRDSGSKGRVRMAASAAWHAARMLHEGVTADTMNSEAMRLFHVPWCFYLATLTCWAFHHARPRPRAGRRTQGDSDDDDGDDYEFFDDGRGDDEMVWDPKGEMETLVSSMAAAEPENLVSIQGRRRTNGLVWVMADVLSKVRWGIVHSGVMVLRGLVPMRLINQYETM